MKYKAFVIALLLFVLTSALTPSVFADRTATPTDWSKITENGQYILVMLAGSEGSTRASDHKLKVPLRKYPHSGLYKNDGSLMPLWTVDWFDFGVEVSSDGHHMVQWGPWPTKGQYGTLALSFYRDGKPIAGYAVDELVVNPVTLPRSVSHFQWRYDSHFDDKHGLLSLETLHKEKYVFDVTNGKIISAVVPTSEPMQASLSKEATEIAKTQEAMPTSEAVRKVYGSISLGTLGMSEAPFCGLGLSFGALALVWAGVSLGTRRKQLRARRTR